VLWEHEKNAVLSTHFFISISNSVVVAAEIYVTTLRLYLYAAILHIALLLYIINHRRCVMRIESLEQWNNLALTLTEGGYRLFQWQYGADCPEGLHAWFASNGKADIEVVTHSPEVERAIIKYKLKQEKPQEPD
jgi:hypothetical protein